MKITIVCFQKRRHPELEAAGLEYLKRLSRHAEVAICPVKNWDDSTGLPDHCLGAGRRIGLYPAGETFTSEELARRLQRLMNQGHSHLVLVVGGAEGIPARTAAQVQERWSLSRLTFSHQLARLLLLEALYRSFDIIHGGQYHK
jgi:23S rRNA (pseudouridine1915-N3)-methyltransferase